MITIDVEGNRIVKVEIEGNEVELEIEPEGYDQVLTALDWQKKNGIEDRSGAIASSYMLIRRIKSWKGIALSDGKEAPCTEENKMRFFGKYPQAMIDLVKEINKQEDNELKNSKPSHDG